MFKRVLIVLIIFSFISCTKNDGSANLPQDTVVLQNVPLKITETIYYSTPSMSVSTGVFNYENGVLKNINYGVAQVEFIYNGDKIEKTKYYQGASLIKENIITYSGDKIASIVNSTNTSKTEFFYSNNLLDIITESTFSGGNWNVTKTKKYFFNNANNISTMHTVDSGQFPYTAKEQYVYDNKNNPFKNLNKYLRFLFQYETIDIISVNNINQRDLYPNLTATTPSNSQTYQITYNSNNYPTLIKKNNGSTLISKIEIVY